MSPGLSKVISAALLILIFELLRRRKLREKYAVLWMTVGITVLVLSFFPRWLSDLTSAAGVTSGTGFTLFLMILFLLVVCVHLSWETSRLEEETRTLAEEIALIRVRLYQDSKAE